MSTIKRPLLVAIDLGRSRSLLTPDALLSVVSACRRAEDGGRLDPSPFDLLAALLDTPDASLRQLLDELGVAVDALRRVAIAGAILRGDSLDHLIQSAAREAAALGARHGDDVHLFLATLGDYAVAKELGEAFGLTRERARAICCRRRSDNTIDWATVVDRLSRRNRLRRRMRRLTEISISLPLGLRHDLADLRAATRPAPPIYWLMGGFVLGGGALLFAPGATLTRLATILFLVCGWMVQLCLHEYAHAAVAFLGGDREVEQRGGLAIDPRRYLNPVFSVIFPLLYLIGGGIPLPGGSVNVASGALWSRRWDQAVSAAGPLTTIGCLLISAGLAFVAPAGTPIEAGCAALTMVFAGVSLLNLLPIPPLDGYHILEHYLPGDLRRQIAQLGWLPILALYVLLGTPGSPVNDWYWTTVYTITDALHVDRWAAWQGLDALRLT